MHTKRVFKEELITGLVRDNIFSELRHFVEGKLDNHKQNVYSSLSYGCEIISSLLIMVLFRFEKILMYTHFCTIFLMVLYCAKFF